MKVWVVIEGWNYEGYGPPEGVFGSEEAAERFAGKVRNRRYKPDFVAVYEMVLDQESVEDDDA